MPIVNSRHGHRWTTGGRRRKRNSNKERSRTAKPSVNGAQKLLIETHQITSKKKPVIDWEVSMDTLSEEFKPVASKNYEF